MSRYAKGLTQRFQIRGSKEGFCAICRDYGKLTVDHVPPKNCGNIKSSVISTLFANGYGKSHQTTITQGGSHFKTICSRCNSTLLGTHYDPALRDVVMQVVSLINTKGLLLPKTHFFDYKPNRFIRSVLGHLLAANAVGEITKDDKTSKVAPLDAMLRAFVMDPQSLLPEDIDIYYWLYPYQRRVIVKHGMMAWFGTGGDGVYGHIFKFFPFGFWVVQRTHPTPNYQIHLPKINQDLCSDIDADKKFLISISPLQSPSFPEAPPDNGMWLFKNDLACEAVDR